MGKIGCTINGTLDDSKFNEPMPWIGIYVVAASAACSIAMAIDTFHGFRHRKFWFPCKFFALNATTLTLIGVAVKLSVDLNTSMPRPHDQLAKLSSTAFICTAIGNYMPSLGTMETKELMMNVVALGILVVTLIVNICIQLGTGVIYVFWIEHIIIMSLTVVLFALLISSSLAIPTIKCYFDLKYKKKYKMAKRECGNNNDDNTSATRKLRDDLIRYWMMAHTCNPQFVVGRLATCTASGAFCLLSALTLAEATLRSYVMPWCFKFCNGESDYKWSTTLILVSQGIAVGVGTIAPASRWFIAIKFRCPKKTNKTGKVEFSVENYWIRALYQLKESPINLRVCGRYARKALYRKRNNAIDLCIWYQKAMVLLSKLVRLISIFSVSRLIIIQNWCKKLARVIIIKLNNNNNNIQNCDDDEGTLSKVSSKIDLRHFVLHLEGEEELIDLMTECERDATGHWIKMGRKKQPKYLIQFLEKRNFSQGFEGVQKFDSDKVPSLDSEEPPNCWALPVVTLTSIVVAISKNDEFHSVKELLKCVNEGLKYIRIIENSLDIKRDLVNIRKAAEIVWMGVDLHDMWLDVDLHEIARHGKNPKDIISQLSEIARNKFMELRKTDVAGWLRDSPLKWQNKVLAANAMYRICQTLLLTDNNVKLESLEATIADITGACLTNLRNAIEKKCHQNSIEEREECVRSAILLLGKTEKILEILRCQPLPSSDPEELACINEWRALSRAKEQLCYDSSPTKSESAFSTSSDDLYLNIDQGLLE